MCAMWQDPIRPQASTHTQTITHLHQCTPGGKESITSFEGFSQNRDTFFFFLGGGGGLLGGGGGAYLSDQIYHVGTVGVYSG